MTDRTYDGVIVGAGHHGLILGSYLARAGLDVALVERRPVYGGGLDTSQPGPAGFYQNRHSINHFNVTGAPWYRDLGLASRVPYATPRYDFAQPHADGTALVLSQDIDETCASIARFSRRDAATFREWHRRTEGMSDGILWPERYSEPLPEDERIALLRRSELGRGFLDLIEQPPLEVVDELFESEQVKLMLLFKLSLFGTVLYDLVSRPHPAGPLVRGFDLSTRYQVCLGGSFNLARGLMEAFVRSGGTLVTHAHVDRIVVEGGAATGVELAGGRRLRARRFVASAVDVSQTFGTMVGPDWLPPDYRRKVEAFQQTGWTFFGVHLALKEAPRYSSTAFDPHINAALKYNIGCESLEQLWRLHDEVARGEVPSQVSFAAGHVTQFDPSQAPDGGATAYAWHAMPFAPGGAPENIEPVKDAFADRVVERWRDYAPNLTEGNILHRYVHTANDYSRDLVNMTRRRHLHGLVRGRSGPVEPHRLSHADRRPVHGRVGDAPGRRHLGRWRLHLGPRHRRGPGHHALVATRRRTRKLDRTEVNMSLIAMRSARPTADLDVIRAFYEDVVGLPVLWSFVDHDGFDGVIFGVPDERAQLELVRSPHGEVPTPTNEDALVLYCSGPDQARYVDRLRRAGTAEVAADDATLNPYWPRSGAVCFVDPDGYRLILVPE